MTIAEYIVVAKDLTIAVAAAITALVAYKGVESWRSELRGKSSFEAAKRLMVCSYKLRDEISYCRSPFVPIGEFPEGYDPMNRSNQTEGDAYVHIYKNRFEPVRTAILELDTVALEAEALWGNEIRASVQELRSCAQTLNANITAFIRSKYDGRARDSDFEGKMNSVLNEINDESDEFSKRIRDAIKEIEIYVQPHLART